MRLKRQRLKHIQHLQTSSNLPVGVEPALLKPPRESDRDWTRGGRVVVFFFPLFPLSFQRRTSRCRIWQQRQNVSKLETRKHFELHQAKEKTRVFGVKLS